MKHLILDTFILRDMEAHEGLIGQICITQGMLSLLCGDGFFVLGRKEKLKVEGPFKK